MNRPDAMDLDVAALLGLDAAMFVQAPAKAPRKARARRASGPVKPTPPEWVVAAQRTPWPWLIAVPLAAALVVGLGMSWRSEDEPAPARTAEQSVTPEPAPRRVEAPRAMSLRIIDGPRPAERAEPQRPRPRNIPMAELGLPPASVASHQAAPAPAAAPAPEASSAPAPVLDIEPMSLFTDEELAPSLRSQPPEAQKTAP